MHQFALKIMQRVIPLDKLCRIKCRAHSFQMFRIRQPPLVTFHSDFPAQIAFKLIARQDDLGTIYIIHQQVKHTRVVVVEKSEPRQSFCFRADRLHKTRWVLVALVDADTK